MVDHTIRAFDTDLQQLAGKIAEMGRLDGEQIADAITALVKRDTARAERVIATDDRVDEQQREIEEKAVATIVTCFFVPRTSSALAITRPISPRPCIIS